HGKPCCASVVRPSSTRRGACCSRARWAGSAPGPCGPACCVSGAAGCSRPSAWPSGCSRSCASCRALDCSTGRRRFSSRRHRPSPRAAQPPSGCGRRRALVHNGIIETADALRAALERDGHRFRTDTDTETLAHLIEDASGATLEERVIAALGHVEGTYGLAVMSADEPAKIVVARQGSPVLLGIGADECFVASDASAVLAHTRSVVYLDDGDIAVLTPHEYHVIDSESHVQVRAVDDIKWDLDAIELGGYPHFMLKEICEQPETVRSTLRGRLLFAEGTARLNGLNLTPEACAQIRRITIV